MSDNKFVLVPVEPTPEMIAAAQFHTEHDDDAERGDPKNYRAKGQALAVWHEMIAAAPQAAPMPDEHLRWALKQIADLAPVGGAGTAVFMAREALSAAPVSEQPQEASTAQPDSERETQYVAELRKELQGWKQEAKERQHENELLRERMQLRTQEQRRDVWFWQGDGEDHLESMSNGMAVVIRADRLRALAAPQDAQERDATKLRHPLCGGAGNVGKEPEL
jgi:hypothetical protein